MSDTSQYMITQEPYYHKIGQEVERYEAAYNVRMPVLLKGPTGCGKSRFVEYMAWKLQKPLISVACNEDMTASDLVGRFLLDATGTKWQDGPLTTAARIGAICYLDEIVEARQDTTVVIHPLTDHRRQLPLEKKGELVNAHPDFQIVISYNPGYQSIMKDLKQSTKQRFGAMSFDYPPSEMESEIIAHETGVDRDTAEKLVQIAERSRNLKGHGLDEGMSTRLLIYAGQLIAKGINPADACHMAPANQLAPSMQKHKGCRLWATPTVMYTRENWTPDAIEKRRQEVKAETNAKGKHHTGNGFGLNLAQQARMWPTPIASDNRNRGNLSSPSVARRKEKGKQIMLSQLVSHEKGTLNPNWVEWLMGFPVGWTNLQSDE